MTNNPYFYISLIALLIKIWASYRLRQNRSIVGASLCLLFLMVTYFQTIIEIYGYSRMDTATSHADLQFLKLYYMCVAAFITMTPLVFLTIINNRVHLKSYFYGLVGFIFIASVVVHPTMMIIGMEKLEYTFTRVAGKYYWIFTAYCVVILLITVSALIQSYRTTEKEIAKIKSANLLIAFIPVMITIFAVIILMRIGLPISANGILPLLLSILVLAMAENLRSDYLIDLRFIVPGTDKFKYVIRAAKPFFIANPNPENVKNYMKSYERSLLEIAEQQFDNTKDKMAFLKKSKSTYYRLLKEREKRK